MDRATQSARRILDLEAGFNFRELGGYETKSGQVVKYHKVIRSAGLGDLTDNDTSYLAKYGVKTDVDFRSKDEIAKKPDHVPNGAEYISLPVFSEDQTEASKIQNSSIPEIDFDPHDGFNHMLEVYRNMIMDDQSRQAYRKFFDQLLGNTKDNDVVLFHCTAGKDRTGMGAVFFLYSLGVPLPTIKEDYLLTNQASKIYVANVLKQVEAKDPTLVESIRALLTVNEQYLDVAQKAIEETSGNLDNYIRTDLKVSDNEISDLKKIYLKK